MSSFNLSSEKATQRYLADAASAALALGFYLRENGPEYSPSTSAGTIGKINQLASDLLMKLDRISVTAADPTPDAAVHLSGTPLTRTSSTAPLRGNQATREVMEQMQK